MSTPGRDLRLDFFRGLGLLFIFVDHIPDNAAAYFTMANFVFNDAAELFVFISGYAAATVFGGILDRHGAPFAITQVLKRCWTLYVAHIFLFVIFVANVAYTATRFNNPMFIEEMNVASFLAEPHVAVVKALALQFHPNFMGILPLYIVLLLGFALLLPLLRVKPVPILAGSGLLYLAAPVFHLNVTAYPEGVWYFNPLAWQFLFVIGATLGLAKTQQTLRFHRRPAIIAASAAFLLACLVAKTWMTVAGFYDAVPPGTPEFVWLIGDKTNLGPLRLLNFLALAHLAVVAVPGNFFDGRRGWPQPVILCGQNSLNIFCLGIFLSFTAHLVLVEASNALAMQLGVSAAGVLIMIGVARFLAWSRGRSREPASARAIQGGE